ncbi:MAG TPA: DNA-processing protein DprA [Verrucomicrobiae bacterium]|jgi:DNA processing protein|nr:DNA-processing protein DprA [Verrucomicrobiae bacterium]
MNLNAFARDMDSERCHNVSMNVPVEMTPTELLGQLNEVEQKYAPQMLFVVGRRDILNNRPRVSIVGSRKASAEGIQRARKLAKLVVQQGGLVVSGLAAGIDTAAHTSAINSNGFTAAVIGTPLSKSYPRENTELQALIQREHLCVSQFPEGYPTQPKNFPIRNRTMALISDATVIIEAGEKSGAISQGWEALRLGRGLFISKAVVDNRSLTWPDEMLAHGAEVLSDKSLDAFFSSLPVRILPFELNGISF